jgi:hypothetical protein
LPVLVVVEVGLEARVAEGPRWCRRQAPCREAGGDRGQGRTVGSRGVRGSRSRGRSRSCDARVRSRVSSSWYVSSLEGKAAPCGLDGEARGRSRGAAPRASYARGRIDSGGR